MSYNWINPDEFSFNSILLMDRYMIRIICTQGEEDKEEYIQNLGVALAYNPAAAKLARHVYASEPVDRLRDFMREKIAQEGILNVTVLDGMCDWLPYEDNTFDIVMSGHVVGDDYDEELAELERVTQNGGWILDCPGEDDRKNNPKQEMLQRGFEYFYYVGKTGGDIYRYRKQVIK